MIRVTILVGLLVVAAAIAAQDLAVGARETDARTAKGEFISWREHTIDDESTGGKELQGSDGLVLADFDKDGHIDVVSVHESDTEYDGNPDGMIRIAFGSAS